MCHKIFIVGGQIPAAETLVSRAHRILTERLYFDWRTVDILILF